MCARPIVGVPADRRVLDPHPFHMVGEKYLQALNDGAGVLPLIIPVLEHGPGADDFLAACDGIFLTGSPSNIEPRHYNGEPSSEGSWHDPARDAMTLPLGRKAIERGIPLFAICRGFQELNVSLGGTLHQQVAEVPGLNNHKEDAEDPVEVQYGPAHDVNLVPGGMLAELAGAERLAVNSLHGQGVRQLAVGVSVEAVADDGLVEAFRVDDAESFALAVQWHPEWQVQENEFSMRMFAAFGDACRAFARRKAGVE